MSNLYKQRYVISETANARVINSNEMVEQRLQELKKDVSFIPAGVSGEGFTEGLVAETVEIEPEPEIDYVAVAKAEAETMLEQAKREAEQMLQEARTQAVEIREQAAEVGKQEGFESGSALAREEVDQRIKELDVKEKELDSYYQRQLEELEPQLLDAILQVVEKVFHIQFDDKKDILLYLITKTIHGVEGCKQFQIRVGQDNYQFLVAHKEDLMSRIGADMSLEIITDNSVRENQCMIETDVGVFGCDLGAQLENLIKDLRSLCS